MTNKSESSRWSEYNKDVAPPRPRLVTTLDQYCKEAGHALDLGCGSGGDTFELLRRGWKVTAVDADAGSLDVLRAHASGIQNLEIQCSDFESLELSTDTYDLINASYALPFCKPDRFADLWQTMIQALKPNGTASFELFGVNDDWAKLPAAGKMCFHSRMQVDALLSSLIVDTLKENEFRAATFAGPEKHWHVFQCIVRKPQYRVPSP